MLMPPNLNPGSEHCRRDTHGLRVVFSDVEVLHPRPLAFALVFSRTASPASFSELELSLFLLVARQC